MPTATLALYFWCFWQAISHLLFSFSSNYLSIIKEGRLRFFISVSPILWRARAQITLKHWLPPSLLTYSEHDFFRYFHSSFNAEFSPAYRRLLGLFLWWYISHFLYGDTTAWYADVIVMIIIYSLTTKRRITTPPRQVFIFLFGQRSLSWADDVDTYRNARLRL